MLEERLLTDSSTSYSQFLQTKPMLFASSDNRKSPIDIDFFKRAVSLQHFYAATKRQNFVYRFIFFGFSFLFTVFGLMIFFKTANPLCSLTFGDGYFVKNLVNLFCILLSGGAFVLGYKIHPEKEAIKHLVKKVESELRAPAKQIQIEFHAIMANLSHHW